MAAQGTHKEYLQKLSAQDIWVRPTERYINSYTPIVHICKGKHLFSASPDKILWSIRNEKRTPCRDCENRIDMSRIARTLTIQQFNKVIRHKGVKALDYVNMYTPAKFKCLKCRSVYEAKPSCIRISSGCPVCLTDKQNEWYQKYVTTFKEKFNITVSKPERKGKMTVTVKYECNKCKNSWRAPTSSINHRRVINACAYCKTQGVKTKPVTLNGEVEYVLGNEPIAINHLIQNRIVTEKHLKVVGKSLYIEWKKCGKLHKHYPDLLDIKTQTFYEVKSEVTLGLTSWKGHTRTTMFNSAKAKAKAALDLGYNYTVILVLGRTGSGTPKVITLPKRFYRWNLPKLLAFVKRSSSPSTRSPAFT